MDIFRFTNPVSPTLMEQGEIVNGIKSKMWVERYDQPGEFKIISNIRYGLKDLLPIGSFISHIDTTQIMVVENHEINDDQGKETEIIITGRSFESYLEHRVSGTNFTFPAGGSAYWRLILYPPGAPWDTLQLYISEHIKLAELTDPDNALPWVTVIADVDDVDFYPNYRGMPRANVYEATLEFLRANNLGLKSVRPGPWAHPDTDPYNTGFIIYRGIDRSADIVFSYDAGEIESADYFWSNRTEKNYALVEGKWKSVVVHTGEIKYDRRMIYVDGSSVDSGFNAVPTGSDLADVIEDLTLMGIEALSVHNDIAITKVEVSKKGIRAKYRTDYNIGDLIMVNGDYNETVPMRVIEYIEIEDENGMTGYPTLNLA